MGNLLLWCLNNSNVNIGELQTQTAANSRALDLDLGKEINLTIININGVTKTLAFRDHFEVEHLKDEVARHFGIPVGSIQLSSRGRSLAEGTVKSNRLLEGGRINIIKRFKGGFFASS